MRINEIVETALPNQFSINFNGVDLSRYFYIKSDSGRGVSNRELSLLTIPSQNGSHLIGSRYPSRKIVVEVLIACDSAAELRKRLDEINAVLAVREPSQLIFGDEMDRAYHAISESVSEGYEIDGWHVTTISFVCPDPYKYGNRQIDAFADSRSIYNQGTAVAEPVFNIHFTKASTNFSLARNDQTFRLIREFVAGDRVAIDCKRGLVQLNGLDAMPIRDWRTPFKRLLLGPGENHLTADPGADVEVTFTERYL